MDTRIENTKVLIVDDDYSSRKSLAHLIRKKWPFKILQAEDGSEAIQLILKEAPNLIILDIIMPFMNGIEVLKIVRNNPKTAGIPVIACTAVDEKQAVAVIREYGIDDYVIKPIDQKTLIEKITHAIEASPKEPGEKK